MLLKERVERLYSFRNGVAKIRLCKCWQLISVQLLGNQKYNCSCLLYFKYKTKTLQFLNFKSLIGVSKNTIALVKIRLQLCFVITLPSAISSCNSIPIYCILTCGQNIYRFCPNLQHHYSLPKYLPISAKTR